MRKTRLLILLVFGLICTSTLLKAQSGRFSVGLDLGLPMGDFADAYDLGFGGSFRYEHPIGDNIGIGATTGLIGFAGSTIDYGYGATTEVSGLMMIPFQAFFKYYFMEQQKGFYAMANLGITYSASASTTDPTTGEDITNSSTDFSYAPEVGYCLDHFDFGLRYQMISSSQDVIDETTLTVKSETVTNSFLGIRVAYVFGSPN